MNMIPDREKVIKGLTELYDEAYARNYYDNASKKYVDNDLYEEQVKAAVQDVQDCYLTFVDIHE